MTKEQWILALEAAGSEKLRPYELKLTQLAVSGPAQETEAALREILNSDASETARYNAFYCLNILLRRSKDYPRLDEIIRTYGQSFRRHITFKHLVALYQLQSDSFYDYDELLNSTYRDAELFSDNAGFVHLFADVFVTICEKSGRSGMEPYLQEWQDEAMEKVNAAIDLDPSYAKYYCTKARILLLSGDYSHAEANINKAIGLEDSHRQDYFLRISGYQYYKLMIQMERRLLQILEDRELGKTREGKTGSGFGGLQPYRGSEPYVFISYSHRDIPAVARILWRLRENGVRFWFDEGIEPNAEWLEEIGRRIRDCAAFALFISGHSVVSRNVRNEIYSATEVRALRPVCYYLEETELSPGMELQLGAHRPILAYFDGEEEAVRKLIAALPDSVKEARG